MAARAFESRWTVFGLAVSAVAVAVAVTEPAIRALLPVPARGYGVWAGYPGSRLTMTVAPDGFEAVHRYNRYGFRGADFPIASERRFRIACVGDSYTEGLGAAEHETWPARLGERLRDLDAEVLNLGDAGSEMERYSRIVHDVALPLAPTDVVVCLLPTDLRNGAGVAPDLAPVDVPRDPFRDDRGWTRPVARLLPGWTYLVERAVGRWPVQEGRYWRPYDDAAAEGAVYWLVENRRLPLDRAREIVRERLRQVEPAVLAASRRGEFNPTAIAGNLILPYLVYRARVDDMRVSREELAAGARAWLAWYARVCRDRGIRPWLVYFPTAPLVIDGAWGPFRDDAYRDRPRVTGDVSMRDLVAALAAEAGVELIDLTPVFAAHAGERLFLRYDTHPTARAYDLAAATVAERLRADLGARLD